MSTANPAAELLQMAFKVQSERDEALQRASQLQQALETIGEYPCSHGDECQGREARCPSCIAHAVLAEPEEEEE